MQLDWYQATIPADVDHISSILFSSNLFSHSETQDSGGMGYRARRHFLDTDGDCHCRLYYDGAAAPSLQLSGSITPEATEIIREAFPKHSVSRADVAIDFSEVGAFAKMREQLDLASRANNIKSGFGIIPREEDKGETFYVGSTKSAAQLRLYQKGLQLVSKGRIKLEDADRNWVRLEAQLRPNKSAEKAAFSTLTPQEMLGSTRWVPKVYERILGLEIARLEAVPHVTSDIEKTMIHLMDQYGGTLYRYAEVLNRRKGSKALHKPAPDQLMVMLMQDLSKRLLGHRAWNPVEDAAPEDFYGAMTPAELAAYEAQLLASGRLNEQGDA